jgi:hypothetical protein
MFLLAESSQIIDAGRGADDDVTAVAAVAAIWSASRDELLAPEADATFAAAPADYFDLNTVDEHGGAMKEER